MAGVFNKNALPDGNARHILMLLVRNADIQIPEQKLMFAVVMNAIQDLMDKTPSKKAHSTVAGKFFTSGTHVFFCDMCGLDPDWVVEILRDHAGLDIGR
jgi:hypothetical protein